MKKWIKVHGVAQTFGGAPLPQGIAQTGHEPVGKHVPVQIADRQPQLCHALQLDIGLAQDLLHRRPRGGQVLSRRIKLALFIQQGGNLFGRGAGRPFDCIPFGIYRQMKADVHPVCQSCQRIGVFVQVRPRCHAGHIAHQVSGTHRFQNGSVGRPGRAEVIGPHNQLSIHTNHLFLVLV